MNISKRKASGLILALVLMSALFVIGAMQVSQGPVVIQDGGAGVTQASVKTAGTITPNVLGVQGNANGVPMPVVAGAGGLTSTVAQGTGGTTAAMTWLQTLTDGVRVTAYAGTAGMTTIVSGATSAFTATTTWVPGITCNNISAAGANTVTVMDGNGKYFMGPNFSIPASSSIDRSWNGGQLFTGGINMSAGASNVIQCAVSSGSKQ